MNPWDNVTPPSDEILDRWLSKAKGQFFMKELGAGFLGSLICNHDYVWDDTCDTAWCDGTKIGFNRKFFTWMTPASRLTVLVHELWHTGYDHMERLQDRHPRLWNIAADYVINNQMVHWGYDFTQLMQIGPCLDHDHDNKTTEQIYDELEIKFFGGKGKATQPGKSTSGQQGQGPAIPATGIGDDLKPAGSTEEKIAVKENQIKAVQAAQATNDAGSIPGELLGRINTFFEPELPWEVLLAQFYTELSQDDYSWKRPSRRYEDDYLPSLDGDNKLDHLIYYMDISGSVTDEQVKRFFSEVKYIHEFHAPKKITMKTFDTRLHDVFELEPDDPFAEFEIHGRGGTCLRCVQKDIMELKPTAAVVFSDMYVPPMEKDPGVPLLWVIMDNPRAQVPFGTPIHIKA